MLTEIGKELRKLRIDQSERLLDMAARLQKSSSFISAIEVGKKPPPASFEETVINVYKLDTEAAEKLRQAADQSRHHFTLEPSTAEGRDVAGLLSRRMDRLTNDEFEEIRTILKRGAERDGSK